MIQSPAPQACAPFILLRAVAGELVPRGTHVQETREDGSKVWEPYTRERFGSFDCMAHIDSKTKEWVPAKLFALKRPVQIGRYEYFTPAPGEELPYGCEFRFCHRFAGENFTPFVGYRHQGNVQQGEWELVPARYVMTRLRSNLTLDSIYQYRIFRPESV